MSNNNPKYRRHWTAASSDDIHKDINQNNNKERKTSIFRKQVKDASAGAIAGALSKTVMAPIERVKLMLQLHPSLVEATAAAAVTNNNTPQQTQTQQQLPPRYGAIRTAQYIYQQEGLLHFWRGNTPNVIRQACTSALNFLLMDHYKRVVLPVLDMTIQIIPSNGRTHSHRLKRRRMLGGFLSGGLAGGTVTTVLYPLEFLRTRLAMDYVGGGGGFCQSSGRDYPRGMRDVLTSILRTDGIRGLYQGYGIALAGVVLYRALHLGGYDAVKTEIASRRNNNRNNNHDHNNIHHPNNHHNNNQKEPQPFDRKEKYLITTTKKQTNKDTNAASAVAPPAPAPASSDEPDLTLGQRFVVAQIVSITAGTICYPIDTVRRRLMMQAGVPISDRPYRNAMEAFRIIFRQKGHIRNFYRGIGANLIRSVGGAVLLVGYDVFKELL